MDRIRQFKKMFGEKTHFTADLSDGRKIDMVDAEMVGYSVEGHLHTFAVRGKDGVVVSFTLKDEV